MIWKVSGLQKIPVCSVHRSSLIHWDGSHLSGWNASRGFWLRQLCGGEAAGALPESSWQHWAGTEGLQSHSGVGTLLWLQCLQKDFYTSIVNWLLKNWDNVLIVSSDMRNRLRQNVVYLGLQSNQWSSRRFSLYFCIFGGIETCQGKVFYVCSYTTKLI